MFIALRRVTNIPSTPWNIGTMGFTLLTQMNIGELPTYVNLKWPRYFVYLVQWKCAGLIDILMRTLSIEKSWRMCSCSMCHTTGHTRIDFAPNVTIDHQGGQLQVWHKVTSPATECRVTWPEQHDRGRYHKYQPRGGE